MRETHGKSARSLSVCLFGVIDAGLGFPDGVVGQAQRFGAVPAFVVLGRLKFAAGGFEIVECGLHVRLSREGFSNEHAGCQSDGEPDRAQTSF